MEYEAKQHTFVICAYQESPYIEQCINSLLCQTIRSNIIISSSTPCNYLRNIADKYGLELLINTGEKGIAGDWNYAYNQVNTPLVTIAHQDDIYEPEYLQGILSVINKAGHPLIAFSDYGELRGMEKIYSNSLLKVKRILLLPLRFKVCWGSKFIRRRCLSLGNCICCPAVTYVKPNLPDVIFSNEFSSNLDWQAWEKLSKNKGEFVYYPKRVMLHRIHEESTTSQLIAEKQRISEDYTMFCHFWPKKIASLIMKCYVKGENSNKI